MFWFFSLLCVQISIFLCSLLFFRFYVSIAIYADIHANCLRLMNGKCCFDFFSFHSARVIFPCNLLCVATRYIPCIYICMRGPFYWSQSQPFGSILCGCTKLRVSSMQFLSQCVNLCWFIPSSSCKKTECLMRFQKKL